MNKSRLSILLSLIVVGSAAQAAPPHSVTYSQVSVAPGTTLAIAGTDFVAVQVGVRQFTTDKRYAVRFLSPLYESEFVAAELEARHSNDPLQNQNATIDTFPAQIDVSDGRTYAIETVTDPQTLTTTNHLRVTGSATVTVQVKIGDTLLIGAMTLTQDDQDVDLGPGEYRGTSQSAYGKYLDPTGLVAGLDKWVDYIRVIALN